MKQIYSIEGGPIAQNLKKDLSFGKRVLDETSLNSMYSDVLDVMIVCTIINS